MSEVAMMISEDRIKTLSKDECLEWRKLIQEELNRFMLFNPGALTRALTRLNERLFEVHYYGEDDAE